MHSCFIFKFIALMMYFKQSFSPQNYVNISMSIFYYIFLLDPPTFYVGI